MEKQGKSTGCEGCLWAFRREGESSESSIRCGAPVQENVTLIPDKDDRTITHFKIEFLPGDASCHMVKSKYGVSEEECQVAKSVSDRGAAFLNYAIGVLKMSPQEAKIKYRWAKFLRRKYFTVEGGAFQPEKKGKTRKGKKK